MTTIPTGAAVAVTIPIGASAIVTRQPAFQNFAGSDGIQAQLQQSKPWFPPTATVTNYPFNFHPAIRMVVEWIKASYQYRVQWDDRPVRDHLFSSIDYNSFPPQFTYPGIDQGILERDGQQLLVKAFFAGRIDIASHIDLGKCTAAITELNTKVWAAKTGYLVEWYRRKYGITPSSEAVEEYQRLLCSSHMKVMKQTQMAHGNWPDPNLEMFNHFAKLAACGADDARIQTIYNSSTQEPHAVDASWFGEITPTTWRDYEGWVSHGVLDWGDLGAQNLNEDHTDPGMAISTGSSVSHTYTLAEVTCKNYGNWDVASSSSSSCFNGDTMVTMADRTSRKMSNVHPGDKVTSGGESRIVKFVSQPLRGGRSLFELRDFPGIQFTATHPITVPNSLDSARSSLPVLQFVDNIQAASHNPTWQSFQTVQIASNELIEHHSTTEDGEQVVYDLMFEPSATQALESLPTYTLASSNGKHLEAMSEAPLVE